jgi:hypothetical protein
VVVLNYHFFLFSQFLVALLALTLSLLHLKRPVSDLLLKSIYRSLVVIDHLRTRLVIFEKLLIGLSLGLSL